MLVLTRHVGEGIVLKIPASREPIEILVRVNHREKKSKGQVVSLAIEAPLYVDIEREEQHGEHDREE